MTPEKLLLALGEIEDDLLFTQHTSVKKPSRRLSALLIAAVLASTLALTAFAGSDGAVWFRSFFAQNSHLALTDSQKDFIQENTAAYQQRRTCNGYTIALESAITDGVRTMIQFKVTAPEDTVLDLDSYYPGSWPTEELLVNELGETYFYTGGWDTIDEDKTDNSVTLLYESDNFWYEKGIDQLFGHTWTVRLVGLKGRNRMTLENMDDPPQEHRITDGIWEFEITFPESGSRTVEFVSEPVSCPVTHNFSIQGYIEDTVDITALKVRALSVALSFRHPEKGEINADFNDLFAIRKDGSPVKMNPYYNSPGFVTFFFDAPIVLEDIDHILLPDGTKLYPCDTVS